MVKEESILYFLKGSFDVERQLQNTALLKHIGPGIKVTDWNEFQIKDIKQFIRSVVEGDSLVFIILI